MSSGFRFESLQALYLLWLIPCLYVLARVFSSLAQKKLSQSLGQKLRPFLTSSVSEGRRRWKLRFEFIVLIFMIFAYARPQNGEGLQQVKNEGIEVLFVVDVSNSMLAEDNRPSRLALAKSELDRFVDMSGGDRMGLVAFAGSAVLLSPMTTDHEAMKMYIESLSPDAVQTQGTDFSKALSEANLAFTRGGMGDQQGAAVTRAIIIASDGEDHEPGAMAAAEKLAKEGIHIFTIGFGTEQGGAIPMRDEQGTLRGYRRDKAGQVVMSKTDGQVLKDLAKSGEGSFHHVTDGDAVKSIRADIEKLKKAQFETGSTRNYNENYQWLLVLGFIFALIEMLLGDRRPKGRIWKGRFEVISE